MDLNSRRDYFRESALSVVPWPLGLGHKSFIKANITLNRKVTSQLALNLGPEDVVELGIGRHEDEVDLDGGVQVGQAVDG